MINKILIGITILIVSVIACKKEAIGESDYNTTNLLINWRDSIYLPSVDEYLIQSSQLKNNIISFSNSENFAELEEAKSKWLKLSESWRGVEPFIIGDLRNSFVAYRLDSWPIDTADILEVLNGAEEINTQMLNSLPSDNVGMYALEYLMYSHHLPLNKRYFDLIKELAVLLDSDAKLLEEIVLETEEDFLTSKGYTLSSTIGRVLNQIPEICEEALRHKIAIPIGYYEYVSLDDKMLEAWRSKSSHIIIQNTLNQLKDIFYGYNNGEGLEEYLLAEGETDILKNAEEYFNEAEANFSELSTPLY